MRRESIRFRQAWARVEIEAAGKNGEKEEGWKERRESGRMEKENEEERKEGRKVGGIEEGRGRKKVGEAERDIKERKKVYGGTQIGLLMDMQ